MSSLVRLPAVVIGFTTLVISACASGSTVQPTLAEATVSESPATSASPTTAQETTAQASPSPYGTQVPGQAPPSPPQGFESDAGSRLSARLSYSGGAVRLDPPPAMAAPSISAVQAYDLGAGAGFRNDLVNSGVAERTYLVSFSDDNYGRSAVSSSVSLAYPLQSINPRWLGP